MRLLDGNTDADLGGSWIAGHSNPFRRGEIKEKIGYCAQKFGLYEEFNGDDGEYRVLRRPVRMFLQRNGTCGTRGFSISAI